MEFGDQEFVSLGGRSIAGSIQVLRKDELKLLLSMLSKREISDKVRDALWLIHEHGYELTFAASRCNVSYRHISNAEKKLLKMHDGIMSTYVDKYLYGEKK